MRQQCKLILTMSLVLGLPWLEFMFLLERGKPLEVMQCLVTAMNSLQGFWVFLLFVPLRREVREHFVACCHRCCMMDLNRNRVNSSDRIQMPTLDNSANRVVLNNEATDSF